MPSKRLKQVLMGIGLLTVLGVLAMAGLIAYLWWDAKDAMEEVDTETDFETKTPAESEDESAA